MELNRSTFVANSVPSDRNMFNTFIHGNSISIDVG